jgi:hypothetical protein
MSCLGSSLAFEDLSGFVMGKLVSLNHGDDGVINSSLVVESVKQFLLELGVGNFGANGNSAFDCILDFADEMLQLSRRISVGRRHAGCSCIHGGHLKDTVCLLYVLWLDLSGQVHPCNGFRQSDYGFELTNGNWDS